MPAHRQLAVAAGLGGVALTIVVVVLSAHDAHGLGSGATLWDSMARHLDATYSATVCIVTLITTAVAAITSQTTKFEDVAAANAILTALAMVSFLWYALAAIFDLIGHSFLYSLLFEQFQTCMWFAMVAEAASGGSRRAWAALGVLSAVRIAAYVTTAAMGTAAAAGDAPGILLVRLPGGRLQLDSPSLEAGFAVAAVGNVIAEACLAWVAMTPTYFMRYRAMRGHWVIPTTRAALTAVLLLQLLNIAYGAAGWDVREARLVQASIKLVWYIISSSTMVVVLASWRAELTARSAAEAEAGAQVHLSRSVADARAQIIRWGMHELRVPFNSLQLGIEDMKDSLRAGDAWSLPNTLSLMSEAASAMDRVLVRCPRRRRAQVPSGAIVSTAWATRPCILPPPPSFSHPPPLRRPTCC